MLASGVGSPMLNPAPVSLSHLLRYISRHRSRLSEPAHRAASPVPHPCQRSKPAHQPSQLSHTQASAQSQRTNRLTGATPMPARRACAPAASPVPHPCQRAEPAHQPPHQCHTHASAASRLTGATPMPAHKASAPAASPVPHPCQRTSCPVRPVRPVCPVCAGFAALGVGGRRMSRCQKAGRLTPTGKKAAPPPGRRMSRWL